MHKQMEEKPVSHRKITKEVAVKMLIGITREKIFKIEAETRRVTGFWTWPKLSRFELHPGGIIFDFGDWRGIHSHFFLMRIS